jgi:glycosyltransferase involved in cell wall biosynthesis
MDTKPLVSICTPVFNGENFLEESIKGVLNQTYANYEYIIVDNASTDDTPLIIEKYRKKFPRIKIYRNEKTLHMEDNLNLSAQYCSDNAKWIKYAFANDYLFPDCVEKMVAIGELDDQIGIVSAYRLAGATVTNWGLPMDKCVFDGAYILKQQILRKIHVASSSPNTLLYNKKVFFELNGFNNTYEHSDTELALRLLDRYKMGFAHYVLTISDRTTGGGEYYSIIHGRKILEYLDFGYKKIGNYKSIRFDQQEMDYLKKYYVNEVADFLVKKYAYFEWEDIKKMTGNIPNEIKREIKAHFFNNLLQYMKKYFRSLIYIRSYHAEKKKFE